MRSSLASIGRRGEQSHRRPAAPTFLDAHAKAQMTAADVGAQLTVRHEPDDRPGAGQHDGGRRLRHAAAPADPTQPTRRMIFGVPLLASPEAPVGTIWGLPAERVVTAVRRDAAVRADRSVFSTSDRVGFGFPHTAAQVRIGLAAR